MRSLDLNLLVARCNDLVCRPNTIFPIIILSPVHPSPAIPPEYFRGPPTERLTHPAFSRNSHRSRPTQEPKGPLLRSFLGQEEDYELRVEQGVEGEALCEC